MHIMIPAVSLDHHISRDAVCNMRTKCDTAVCSVRKCVLKSGTDQRSKFFGRLWFQHSKYWCFSFCPECIFPDRLCESDSVRINLCQCSEAASNKPLPMTNRGCHFWLSVRLLVFHMCSSGSFAASEIIVCKDEGLSGEAAGLWQQPFHLFLFSATPSLFPLQSFCLSYLSSPLTCHTHFLSSNANLSSRFILFWLLFLFFLLFFSSPDHNLWRLMVSADYAVV